VTTPTPNAPSSRLAAGSKPAPVAYFWGDDGYGVEAAIEAFRRDPARFPAGAPERWRIRAEAGDGGRLLAELGARLATGTMFGAGTVVILAGAGQLVRKSSDRDVLATLLGLIAEGNGLVVAEETDSGKKDPPARAVADAIRALGGEVRRFEAPREGALAGWVEARARERGIALGPGAARELATRVGGFVREGDVDRRNQGRLTVMELEKLQLRHLPESGEAVSVADVRALVPEVVPGTIWGFVDAVGMRQRARSLELLERLFEATPEPVLLAVLHRRLRELLEVADRLAAGETPGSLVRSMRLQPFRAETLARQARAWTVAELAAALEGLLELDVLVKGVGGAVAGDSQVRLAFDLWLAERVATTD
jgi:DNA polymerase III delta subunit